MIDREKDVNFNAKSLWHGTSSIWIASISKTGLGAINIAKEYRLIELLDFLYSEALRLNINTPGLINRAKEINAIISGRPLYHDDIALNYCYDGTYVSMSPLKAAQYACSIPVGSELLDYCTFLANILKNHSIEIPKDLDLINIMSFLNRKSSSILVEVIKFDDKELLLENGEDAQTKLKDIRNLYPKLDIEEHFKLIQFSNFKLLNPINPDFFKFYKIDYNGNPFSAHFKPKYTLIKNILT